MWQKNFKKNKNPKKFLEIGIVRLNIPILSLFFAFWRNLAPKKKTALSTSGSGRPRSRMLLLQHKREGFLV